MVTATTPSAVYTGAVKSISFTIPSSEPGGEPHRISVNPFTRTPTSCTCKAGQHGRRCWAVKLVASGKHTLKPRVTFGPVQQTTEDAIAAERQRQLLDDLYA